MCSLDATQGFYQIPLTDKSSRLCTMATPRGRYRYLRLPFGLRSARKCSKASCLTCSETCRECTSTLMTCLSAGKPKRSVEATYAGYSKDFVSIMSWLGHVIAEGTLKVDQRKVEAIRNFPDPTNMKSLIRLLEIVTYFDRFCKNLAALTRPFVTC